MRDDQLATSEGTCDICIVLAFTAELMTESRKTRFVDLLLVDKRRSPLVGSIIHVIHVLARRRRD